MRFYFIASILFLVTSCGNKVKENCEVESFIIDSIAFNPFPEYAVLSELDTLFIETFDLKGGYQLILFPEAWYDDSENKISYTHLARLVGEGIDTVFTTAPTYQSKLLLRYDGIDFDDCFAIEYSGGGSGSLYVDVIEKKTGRLIVDGQGAASYDLDNQLVLYESDAGCMMMYDAKKKRFHAVDMPNHPCYGSMGARFGWSIEKVTSRSIYLSHPCDDEIGGKFTKVDRLEYTI